MPTTPILLKGHTRNLTQVVFNRDSDLLVTCAKDSSPQVWYSRNGERLGTYNGHEGAILGCDISHDSKLLATASGDGTTRLWDVYTGVELHQWRKSGFMRTCAFSVDSTMLAVVQKQKKGYCIDIYDVDKDENGCYTDEPLRTFQVPDDAVVMKVCWGRNNSYVLSVDDQGRLMKWSVDDEAVIESIKLSKRPLTDMSLSKDRMMVLVSSKDMSARMVELDRPVEGSDESEMKVLKTYESDHPLNTCAIHPTMNHVLVAGGQDANDVTLSGASEGHFEVDFWHVYYEEHLAAVHGHFGPVNTVAVSPNGLYFASGSEDGYVRLYRFDETYLKGSY